MRLEVLWHLGGVYLDSDFEPYRPLDSLLGGGPDRGTSTLLVGPSGSGTCDKAMERMPSNVPSIAAATVPE